MLKICVYNRLIFRIYLAVEKKRYLSLAKHLPNLVFTHNLRQNTPIGIP